LPLTPKTTFRQTLTHKISFHTKINNPSKPILNNPSKPILNNPSKPILNNPSKPILAYWMLGSAALVFTIVVVGGLTRLTESGLSIVEWNLIRGIKPPTNPQEWQTEFDKYSQFPEYKIKNHHMTLEEFKFIYYMEWVEIPLIIGS
jgi:cytochrome c oxidase assembly protein subunit 15